jgi:hypothetical protein
MGKFRSLRCKVAGDALVDPAVDLVGQIKDFDRHGGSPLQVRGWRPIGQNHGTPNIGDPPDIRVSLTDFNICQSMFRDWRRIFQEV